MLKRLISLVILLSLIINFEISSEETRFLLPKNKPSVFKKIDNIKKNTEVITPSKKPEIFEKKTTIEKVAKEKEKTIVKDNVIKKQLKTKQISTFLVPKKKPKSYKVVSSAKRSKYLNQKDFDRAKLVFEQFKARKWITGYQTSTKIKDKEFKNFIRYLYLIKVGNNATFNDYQIFIDRNSDYPRIGRLRYLAEKKIYLKNTTPNNIINWFEKYPPVSGTGKLKLAEAMMKKNNNSEISDLIKDGWINADLSKSELRYFRNKFKSILSSEDHIKRADNLAWEKKYWDLKRMLKYLPKDHKALYNARQILMSNSYGVDNAIAKVPTRFKKDIGLQYDRLKWRNRRGRLESSLQILYDNSNKSGGRINKSRSLVDSKRKYCKKFSL